MRRSTHNITHTPKISLSFEENKHSGETWSILFISLAQISCTEKTNRLQSTLRLQCAKLISLRFFPLFLLPKVLAFFIRMLSTHRHAAWKKMPSPEKMASSMQFVSISLALACLQRSVTILRWLTLSKLNNLFIVTLNLLSFNNCLCNILPYMFFSVQTWLESKLCCLFISWRQKMFL